MKNVLLVVRKMYVLAAQMEAAEEYYLKTIIRIKQKECYSNVKLKFMDLQMNKNNKY